MKRVLHEKKKKKKKKKKKRRRESLVDIYKVRHTLSL
jgi:hypothetical protein